MGFGSGEGFTPGRHNLVGDFTVEGNMSASAAISGGFFFGDGSFLQNVTGSGGGGGGISFNGSTANGILTYGNASTADVESNITFNGTLLGVGGASPASISASSGLTASSLQVSDGSRHYGMTNEGKLGISSFAANWTNAGNTIADLGTVTTATSITATDLIGTNVDGIIGADTARAGTFTTVTAATKVTGSGVVSNIEMPYITASMGVLIKRNADNADRSPLVAISGASAGGVHGQNQASLWVSGSGKNSNRGVVHIESDGPYTISLDTKNDNTNIIYRAGQGLDDSGNRVPGSEKNIAFKMNPPTDIDDDTRCWALGVDTQTADYRRFRITNRTGVAVTASANYGLCATGSSVPGARYTETWFGFNNDNPTNTIDINGTLCVTGSTILGASPDAPYLSATSSVICGGSLSASIGLTASSLQISDGSRHYGMTNEGKLGIASFAANWTNAGNTVADLGTVTTATSITATDLIGTNIDGIIGADTARAGTFAAIVGTSLNVSEGNITNVGDINCDSVSVDDAAVGLDIQMGGNTGLNKVTLTDDLADALNITEGSNSYLKFTTSNGSEQIVVGKNSTFAGTTIANLGTVTTATSITATDLIGTNVDGIIGADTARAGTFAAIVGTSLNVSEGNITNVGDINCDSISVDDAAVGLDIQMGGTTGLNKITLTDDLADALNITEGSNSYMKFATTNGSEEIVLSKNVDCEGDFGVDGNVTLGNDDGDAVTLKGVPSIVGVSDTSPADLYFKADQSGGDEDIDNWLVRAADGGALSINNKASTSYVAQMTLYPHATQAASLTKVEGQLLAGAALLVGQPNAPTNTGTTTSNNLTIANLLTRIIHNTNGASGGITYTLPTAAAIVAGLTSAIGNAVAGITFDFSVINTDASQGITVATNTGLTTVGSLAVDVGDSATFRVYITNHAGSSEAANVYRIS